MKVSLGFSIAVVQPGVSTPLRYPGMRFTDNQTVYTQISKTKSKRVYFRKNRLIFAPCRRKF